MERKTCDETEKTHCMEMGTGIEKRNRERNNCIYREKILKTIRFRLFLINYKNWQNGMANGQEQNH